MLKRSRTIHNFVPARRGAVILLFSALVVVMLVTAAFSVDVAWMQLTRTELKAATDAATKAAAEALATQQSESAATAAGIEIASQNHVAGRPLKLKADDIEFGHAQYKTDGTWDFDTSQTPRNAVRVRSEMSGNTANGAIGLFFGPVFGQREFTPTRSSIAAHVDQEIALVIDRSGSMRYDMSGDDNYPPRRDSGDPPHPTLSRWAALETGINTFLTVAGSTISPPRVSMTSFADNMKRDVELTKDYSPIRTEIDDYGDNRMNGYTNLSSGMDDARGILNADGVRPLAKRLMIVFTDGQWNRGRDPVLSAADCLAEGIIVHTVTFLDADQSTMASVANITGGRHLHAQTAQELESIFRELALTLPVVLID